MAIEEIDQLSRMDLQKQLAFAYLCAKRFFPNYLFFSNNYNFGVPGVLRSGIDLLYNSIFNKTPSSQALEGLIQEIEANSPRPDDFATFYASIAMYSAGVVYESVSLQTLTDIQRRLMDISTMCTDAVDLFIQERDDMDYNEEGFEEKILNDPLMQEELGIQIGSIGYLKNSKEITESDIAILLELQKEGTGILKIIQ